MKTDTRTRRQFSLQDGLFLVLYLAVLGLVGYFTQVDHLQWDVTQNGRNSLTSQSRRVLGAMHGPVTVTIYAAPQDPQYGDLRAPIRRFLAPYARAKGNFDIKFVDPTADPQAARMAGIESDGEMVVAYGGRTATLEPLKGELNEQTFTNLLMRLARGPRLLLYLDGDGERNLEGRANYDLGDFGERLKAAGFTLDRLDLALAQDVPANAAALVIAGPTVDVSRGEVDKIVRYVRHGGHLLWLIDQGSLHGLSPIADALGLILPPGVVVDPAAVNIGAPATFALATSYGAQAITRGFDLDTVFPLARAIGARPDTPFKVSPLVEVAQNGWIAPSIPQGPLRFDRLRDIRGPVTVALALERKAKGHDSRIVVVGSGDFLSNSYLGNGANLNLGLNMVDWLTHDEQLISIVPLPTRDAGLHLTRTWAAVISIGFALVLPLTLAVTGVVVWRRRRR
ncbi:MAG: GldG family protein [Betaproteobacteria bacterium]|nr:GldG family protein [Betaproteobacteria bacterium]